MTCHCELQELANGCIHYQARFNKPVTGDLAKKLEEQKKQTHSKTLQEAARDNLAHRNADANAETRNWN